MKKAGAVVCWFLILGSLFAFIFFSVSPYKIARYEREGKHESFGSMYPTLKIGDLIVAKEVKLKRTTEIKEGTIVVIEDKDYERRVIHRVVSVGEEIVTKGDFSRYPDPPTPISRIKGVYLFKIPTSAVHLEIIFPIFSFFQMEIKSFPLGFYFAVVLLLGLVLGRIKNFAPRGK